jgi:hypothetical protein
LKANLFESHYGDVIRTGLPPFWLKAPSAQCGTHELPHGSGPFCFFLLSCFSVFCRLFAARWR